MKTLTVDYTTVPETEISFLYVLYHMGTKTYGADNAHAYRRIVPTNRGLYEISIKKFG